METQPKQAHSHKNPQKPGHHGTHKNKSHNADKDKNQTKPSNNNAIPPQKTGTALNEFLCKFRYFNSLPDLPFDAKLLSYPFDELRFAKYTTTSLEKNYKFQMHTEADLGITIDLIDPLAYKTPNNPKPLDEADSKLIASLDTVEEVNGASSSSSSSKRVRPAVFWLYKTKYIAADSALPKRHAGTETKLPFLKNQELMKEDMTRDNQIRSIKATFESSKEAPVHPSQPHLKPLEILPVLPDFQLWPNTYTQVLFDSDPVGHLTSSSMKNNNYNMTNLDLAELKKEAILKGFTSEGRNMNVVAYLLPKKRKRTDEELFDEEEGVEYEWIREYTYEVKTGQEFADTYFFVMSDNNVTYNEIRNRVALSKVKTKDSNFAQPSKITCVTREMTLEERDLRENKTNDILQPELVSGFDDHQDAALVDDQEIDDNAWAVDEEK